MPPDAIPDTWPDRVRDTIKRLRALVAAHPDQVYWRICLQGWLQAQARLEQETNDNA